MQIFCAHSKIEFIDESFNEVNIIFSYTFEQIQRLGFIITIRILFLVFRWPMQWLERNIKQMYSRRCCIMQHVTVWTIHPADRSLSCGSRPAGHRTRDRTRLVCCQS